MSLFKIGGYTKEMTEKIIVSSSFGKDSTAMIHLMLEKGERIDEVMYFETGWDFPEMNDHIRLVEEKTGIKTVRIRYYRYFDEMLALWGWPARRGGWCVALKIRSCHKLFRGLHGTVECIGFAKNEIGRTKRRSMTEKKWPVRFPLIEYGYTTKDTLQYCRDLGYTWGGLYDVFKRGSCFCCPKARPGRREKLREHYPLLYLRCLAMDKLAAGSPRSLTGNLNPNSNSLFRGEVL